MTELGLKITGATGEAKLKVTNINRSIDPWVYSTLAFDL